MTDPSWQPEPAYSPVLASFWDISVGQDWVQVPGGRFPINDTTWTVQDMTRYEEKISTVGIVLAAVLFFVLCVLSLLFLLMKEQKLVGYVQVTVQGPGLHHVAYAQAGAAEAHHFVNYARSLAAAA